MPKKSFRRQTRVVNKSLQYRFLVMIIIYSSILVLFLAFSLFLPDIIQMQDPKLDLTVQAAAADRLLTKHVWVWPAVFVLISIIALHSFRSFWRVIGPLYRFHMVFKQVSGGDLSNPITIRTKDYLHEEEQSLNEMLRTLAEKWEDITQSGRGALESLGELEKKIAAETNRDDTDRTLLNVHRRQIEHLMETARYFKVQKIAPEATSGQPGDKAA